MPLINLLIFTGDSQTTNAIILTDSISLLYKGKSGMGSPDWNVSMVDTDPPSKTPVGVRTCPGHAVVKGNDRADRLARKATLTIGLLLGRSEALRSLRHYLWAQSQDITPLIAWRREALKEEHRNRFKDNVGDTSERQGEAHMGFSERIDTTLN